MSETTVTDSAATPATIVPNFDKTVDAKDFKFRWKKDKLGNQRPTIEIKAGVPSMEGFVEILTKGGKGLELLQDAAYDVIRDALGAYFAENETATADSLDLTKFTWEAIANQPKADRRASTISDEDWAAFAKDYIEVMPAVTNKSVEAVTNATVVYLKKFSIVKTDKPVLGKLKEQLALYMNTTKKGEDFVEILDLLNRKLDGYLAANDVQLLVANL
jgi:hypothetical protein